jgi:5-methylcytosine-specific restriction endonuclease McrA
MEGNYFALERLKKQSDSWHFNLYGINSHGHEILMTVDHIIPVSKGGSDVIENLQTMCFPCNRKKGNNFE